MAIDPRLVASGIQMGRSLAPQGPPIQEMLGLRMQQQQGIMEIMKEILKTHASDVSDLRKLQMTSYTDLVKQASNYRVNDERHKTLMQKANDVIGWDISHWGMVNQALNGGRGKIPGAAAEVLSEDNKGFTLFGDIKNLFSGKGASPAMENAPMVSAPGQRSFSPETAVPIQYSAGYNVPTPTPQPSAKPTAKPTAKPAAQAKSNNPYAQWYPDAFQEDGVWKVIQQGKKYRIQE